MILPKHGSVIASAPADKKTNCGHQFFQDLVYSFRNSKPFLDRKVKRKVIGKIILNLSNGLEEKIIDYERPKKTGDVLYTPKRCGKMLDYLLFPESGR